MNRCLFIALCALSWLAYAEVPPSEDSVQQALTEQQQPPQPFSLLMYYPNYLMPLTFVSQASRLEQSQTPDGQNLQPIEISFQLSVKVPLWTNAGIPKNRVFFAYTQASYWQAYNQSPFFRSSDYQPEIFLNHEVDQSLGKGWRSQSLQLGLLHQSNGEGGTNERTWNRVYAAAFVSHKQWLFTMEPWVVVPDAAYNQHNPDMTHYLGHSQVLAVYKPNDQTVSLTTYGYDSGSQRLTGILTWSIPLTQQFNVYSQVFSGYGQTLFNYNHHTNSLGIGISLNDWL